MDLLHSRIAQYLVFALIVASFVGGANVAFDILTDRQNRRELNHLTELVLHRSELAVDYAFITLSDLAEKGKANCDQTALVEFRRQVYRRGSVKDIRLIDGAGKTLCAAFTDALETESEAFAASEKISALNHDVQLVALRKPSDNALAVVWGISAGSSVVAVVNLDGLLFDVLPEEIRDHGQVVLALSNGTVVSSSDDTDAARLDQSISTFSVASARYPVLLSIKIDDQALSHWNKEPRPLALGVGALFGALFALLVLKVMSKPSDPVRDIDRALERKEFKPFMQPIFSLQTGEIVGCEVLARWVRRDGTLVSPYQFIPLAEDSGRIKPLTYQLILDALQRLQPWLKRNKTFKVAFNIGSAHLLSEGFVDELRGLIARTGVSVRQIVIELTERQELQEMDRAVTVLSELREHGFRIALDDAGTGHSGLSYIQKLPIHTIKIDKFFVDSIETNPAAKAVVEMLVLLAVRLKITTVAEGIETESQLLALAACGVMEGQGYLVSRPLAADDFCAFVENSANARITNNGPLQDVSNDAA